MHKSLARLVALTFAGVATTWCGYANAQTITLKEALQRAGAEAPTISALETDVEAAEGLERQAALRPNPEVSLDVENVGGSGAFRGFNSTETTLAASQRVELGGKRGARIRAARAETRVAELQAALAVAQLGADIRQNYAVAVGARSRLELARGIVERNRELARIARELVDAGREPPLRALRAEAALGEAEARLQEAEAADLSARIALASLWGSQSPPDAVVPEWPQFPDVIAIAPENTIAVQLAGAEADAANRVIAQERANAVPDLSLSAGVRRFEETGDRAFVAGASISIPLGNRNQGAISAAEARARGAEFRRAAATAEAARELASSRAEYQAAAARVATLEERSVPQAQEALRLAQIGYRNGKFTLIDVLDAAATLDDVRIALVEAQEARARAGANLQRLTATPEMMP